MTTPQPEDLATKIVAELPRFFRDGFDQLVVGEGEYIRAGEPRGKVAKIGQAVARSYCRQYGANPNAAQFGNAARIEGACRPYLNDISPDNGPTFRTLFQGGQCPQEYTGNMVITRMDSGFTTTSPLLIILGPFNVRAFRVDQNVHSIDINTGKWRFSGANNFASGPQIWRTYSTVTTLPNVEVRATIANILIQPPGAPDNCGNPPPTTEPGVGIPDTTGPTFRFNPSADLDIPITVEINPDGTIDVDIGTGPINVDLFPPEGGGGGGGGGSGSPPGDVGEADDTAAEDADEDGNASGCAGENQVLGGLKVDITRIPASARQFAPGIYRGAGYIYMGVEGQLDQDFGGSMMRDGQFYLPEKDNLTCWEVQANLGYRLRVTPYYKTLEDGPAAP